MIGMAITKPTLSPIFTLLLIPEFPMPVEGPIPVGWLAMTCEVEVEVNAEVVGGCDVVNVVVGGLGVMTAVELDPG